MKLIIIIVNILCQQNGGRTPKIYEPEICVNINNLPIIFYSIED